MSINSEKKDAAKGNFFLLRQDTQEVPTFRGLVKDTEL
jgi:hypothetical protein